MTGGLQRWISINCLLLDHVLLLTDVDAVQKLTDILVLGASGLRDPGARQRHLVDVNAGDLDLILDVICSLVRDTLEKRDSADSLLSKVVADLDLVTVANLVAGNVNREMRIAESHLVLESLSYSSDHVCDVRAHGAVCQIEKKDQQNLSLQSSTPIHKTKFTKILTGCRQ